MAVELATAYINLVPSAKGIVGNIAKELLPIEGAAAATGASAGAKLGGGLSSSLKSALASLPSASLGPLGSLLGAGLVVGFGAALAGIGREFSQARVQIQRETGLTGAALTNTFNTVKQVLGDAVPASIGTVTTAVDELVRRGVPLGATFNELAKQELELAHITGSDLGDTVETTTALFTKFNVPLREQPAALDAIFKGYQASGQSLSNLTDSLRTGGAAFTQFGFDIFQSTALISSLEAAGVNVQPALAGLRKAFATIAKEGQDPKTTLQNLIKEFSDGTPKTVALSDAMKLFGTRAGTELATAIEQGRFNVAGLLKAITDGKGGIDATAAATRTFGEQLSIFKNQALLALEPIGVSVWVAIQSAIKEAVGPFEEFGSAIAHLGEALAPVGVALAGLTGGAFLGVLGVVRLVATGIDGLATVLGHIPAPVLLAAGAVAILGKALVELQSLGALSSAEDAVAGLALGFGEILNPVTAVIGGLAILGSVISIFSGHASAAVVEAKSLSAALFGASGSGALFASGIGSAASGLADFLAQQDKAGKLNALDDAIKGSSLNLKDVATAVTGTSQQFEALKAGLVDTSGFTAQQKALIGTSQDLDLVRGRQLGLTVAQIEAVQAVQRQTAALDQQRDAFVRSAEGELQLAARSGDLSASQLAAAEAIAHATTGTRGYGAALDFANEAIAENTAKTDQAKIASAAFAPTLNDLKSAIIDGTIGTNDAADAAAKFGLQLDDTKQIISDTQAALKSFVDQGVAGLPSSTDAINSWAQGIATAFGEVSSSAGKSAADVAKAKADLTKALDPAQAVAQVQAQALAIAKFQQNIDTLVSQGRTSAASALLADPNKDAAEQFAQQLVNKPALAAAFDAAQQVIQAKTASLKADLAGPLAQQFLAGGQSAGAAVTQGVTATAKIAPVVSKQTTAALAELGREQAFATASGNLGAAATFGMQRKLILEGIASQQAAAARDAIAAGTPAVAAAAGDTGSKSTAALKGGLNFAGATTQALTDSTGAYDPQNTVNIANAARAGGRVIGFQFTKGISDGVVAGTAGAAIAAVTAAAAIENAVKKALGIASPSTVGVDIGENVIKGIALGLSHTAALTSQSTKIAATLTSAITPKITPLAVKLPAAIVPHVAAASAAIATTATVPVAAKPAVTLPPQINHFHQDIPTVQQIDVINRKNGIRLRNAGLLG